MDLIRNVRLALEEGCGLSYREAVQSEEFRGLLEWERAIYDRHPEGTYLGFWLRGGPHALSQRGMRFTVVCGAKISANLLMRLSIAKVHLLTEHYCAFLVRN